MKSFRVCSVLLILAMLIGACAQPTAVPTVPPPAPTTAPVVAAPTATKPPATAAPTAVPATVVPATKPPATAVPTAAPTIGPTRPPATAAATTVAAAGGAAGKCLRFGSGASGGESATLDPYNIVAGEQEFMIAMIYNRLAVTDNNFKISPELALSWTKNATATEWTYKLRQGVKFHDGKEMTSKDVVWTFQQLLNPAVGSEAAAILAFLKPEGIIAVDPYTVMFKTDKPAVELDIAVSTKNTAIIPYGATKDDLKFTGNGTGPWVPVNYKPGQTPHVLNAFADYWDKGKPKSPCIEMYMIAEEASRMAALQSDQIDLTSISVGVVDSFKKNANLSVLVGPSGGFETFSMWVDTKPFNDNKVRQALKMLVDRQAMVDTLLLGYGEVGDDNPIPPSSPDAWRSKPAPRDVAGAKKLLADAGYTAANPLKVDLYTAVYGTAFVPKSEMFRQQALEAGVIVNVIVGPTSEYWSNVWLKQPFVNSTWNLRPPAEALALNYRQNAKNKETHWERPDFDKLLDDAASEPDTAKRTALLKKAEQMLTEEGGVIAPFFVKGIYSMNKKCSGFEVPVKITYINLMNMVCTR